MATKDGVVSADNEATVRNPYLARHNPTQHQTGYEGLTSFPHHHKYRKGHHNVTVVKERRSLPFLFPPSVSEDSRTLPGPGTFPTKATALVRAVTILVKKIGLPL